MRRTKEWWGALTRGERIWLVYAERHNHSYHSPYIPDDCTECGVCGMPQAGGGGMCTHCSAKQAKIIALADYAMEHKGECPTCDGKRRIINRIVWTKEMSIAEIGCEDWAGEIQEDAIPCPDCGEQDETQ